MATAEELKNQLNILNTSLRNVVEARSKKTEHVNYYFITLGALAKFLSQEEAKKIIPSFAALLTELLRHQVEYTAILKELCGEIADRGDVRALNNIREVITTSLTNSYAIVGVLRMLKNENSALNEASDLANTLDRNLHSLGTEIGGSIETVMGEMEKREGER